MTSIDRAAPDDKGKNRAQDPTEHTPLLSGSSNSYSPAETTPTTVISNRRLRSKLCYAFLFSFSFSVLTFIAAVLLAWSYAAKISNIPPEELVATSVVFDYPSHVDVLGVEHGAIWLRVQAKLGVDAGAVLGIGRKPNGDNLFTKVWKLLGRWGVRRLDKVTVQMSPVHVTPEHDSSLVLTSVQVSSLDVPLTPDPPPDKSWLTDVTVNLLLEPTHNTSLILQFLQSCWTHGQIDIHASLDAVSLRGGGILERSWRTLLDIELNKLRVPLHLKIPSLPGLPSPGGSLPSIGDLVTLQEFHVTSQNDTMSLIAQATFVNPAPPVLQATVPSLPFNVSILPPNGSLPLQVPVTSVSTMPFGLAHPNVTLHVKGTILPIQSSSSGVLSTFLSGYLSGKSNYIAISSSLLPDMPILTQFPAPNPRPQLLQNVTIRDMKLKPKGSGFVANGIVFVRLVLPKGIDIGLDVHQAFPDVLVFDGEVTESAKSPPDASLPNPLPENAFGHIRPEDWLPALCLREKAREGDGATYSISAVIRDVPVQVLPGREQQFSNFVGKVIFGSGGAVAGLLGSASVILNVEGLPMNRPGQNHDFELDGLPFRGSVRIGKKSMLLEQS
ncbi:hypothetical protein AX15_000231 [Amanita polypyramis BW_CC]|nr:hypothetical protein AX15_000231 [Amanita polypyramis BW_CC]